MTKRKGMLTCFNRLNRCGLFFLAIRKKHTHLVPSPRLSCAARLRPCWLLFAERDGGWNIGSLKERTVRMGLDEPLAVEAPEGRGLPSARDRRWHRSSTRRTGRVGHHGRRVAGLSGSLLARRNTQCLHLFQAV